LLLLLYKYFYFILTGQIGLLPC